MRTTLLLTVVVLLVTSAQARPLTVATDLWPPFRMLNEQGQIVGYDIDVLKEVQQRSGLAFIIERMPWVRALRHLQFGESDLMVGLALTAERDDYIDYLHLVYKTCRPAFYGASEYASQLTDYNLLYQFRIGYVNNSAYFARFDNDDALFKVRTTREAQLIQMAAAGNIELFIGTDCQVDYELAKDPTNKLVKAPWQAKDQIDLYYGFSGAIDLSVEQTKIEAALQAMQADGFFQTLNQRYFGTPSVN